MTEQTHDFCEVLRAFMAFDSADFDNARLRAKAMIEIKRRALRLLAEADPMGGLSQKKQEGPWQRREVIGDCVLYLGNCLDLLPTLRGADAIITDPPFFTPAVHYQSRVKHARSWGDMSILEAWWASIAGELARLCPLGHVFVFCGGESYPAFFKAMFPHWEKLKCMVWDKGHVGLGRIFRSQHELIIWARSEGHFLPDDNILRADVLTAKATPSSDREHPVEKPPELLVQLVSVSPGGVLDPFMGSGSTGVACVKQNRPFVGIEIDEKYFDIACRRIAETYAQPNLFIEAEKKAEQISMLDGEAA